MSFALDGLSRPSMYSFTRTLLGTGSSSAVHGSDVHITLSNSHPTSSSRSRKYPIRPCSCAAWFPRNLGSAKAERRGQRTHGLWFPLERMRRRRISSSSCTASRASVWPLRHVRCGADGEDAKANSTPRRVAPSPTGAARAVMWAEPFESARSPRRRRRLRVLDGSWNPRTSPPARARRRALL